MAAPRHLIKKYANRKLYDTHSSRYITLEAISRLVQDGHDIEVVDRETGRDLTPLILSQIVLGEEKRGAPARPTQLERGQALLDYVRRTLMVPASRVSGEVGRRKSDLDDLAEQAVEQALVRLSIPTRRDVEALSLRIDELAARIDAVPAGPRRPRLRAPVKRSRKRGAGARP